MSAQEASILLSDCYERATRVASPDDLPGIRRAFRRALRDADNGDVRAAILLSERWA